MKSIADKFREVRIAKGLTQKSFADALHIKPSYISQIEKGKKTPSDALTSLTRKTFSVSDKWWDTGEGDIFGENQQLDHITFQLMHEWAHASPEIQKAVVNLMKDLREKESEKKK
jgi:transcriptional regulator with XRE-family HTH domain